MILSKIPQFPDKSKLPMLFIITAILIIILLILLIYFNLDNIIGKKPNKKTQKKGKNMKLSEFIKNNDIELSEEQEKQIKKILGIKDNKKWEPKRLQDYYYLGADGFVAKKNYNESTIDKYFIITNNCFKTNEEATIKAKQVWVYNELKNFADKNNGEIDWNDDDQSKYYITYDFQDKSIWVANCCFSKNIGTIYFSSKELAKQAIKEIGEDRIKKYLFEVEE